MSWIKFVEFARTILQGVYLNKCHPDLMHNGGGIAVAFLLHTPESLPLSI
jgi:hypothetical protein